MMSVWLFERLREALAAEGLVLVEGAAQVLEAGAGRGAR